MTTMIGRRRLVFHLCLISLLLFLSSSALPSVSAAAGRRHYIVYMGGHSSLHSSSATEADLHAITNSHHAILATYLGDIERAREAIRYSYTRHINGFTAILNEGEAAQIAKHPGVVSVFPDRRKKLQTTHSWNFMLMENQFTDKATGKLVARPSPFWKEAKFGQDVIIANIDGGVWPESQSFSDEGYGPVPSRWKGTCAKAGIRCNRCCCRKLIGARYFNKGARFFSKGYTQAGGNPTNQSFLSARDSEGHGTHTLSTAGGNFVPQAKILGAVKGTAKGGAPRARVAAYKVCWPPVNESECFDSDILAAFDAAIHDGVDVISVSLGGSADEYFQDAVAIGSFHAVKKGILVSCSAGNSGPLPGTVSNLAPWITTVAASTLDRKFVASVQLDNGLILKVLPLFPPLLLNQLLIQIIYFILTLFSNSLLCKPKTLDPKKAKGKILACLRGDIGRVEKGKIAAMAGASGMILCNDKINGDGDLTADPHFLPATQIGYRDGVALFRYISSTKHPKAYITPSTSMVNVKPAPVMADFSSKGPNTIAPYVLKPDITAPGVNIIAAYTEAKPTDPSEDPRKFPYNILSGTSMSCPHVSGVFGLLRAVYPHWSPSAIRSAIMTTARTRDNARNPILDSTLEKATPFSYGSGHIRPNRAMDPGLVYDLSVSDYLDFLCARGYNKTLLKLFSDAPHECPKHARIMDLNYPSIAVPKLKGGSSITMTRKVKNVGKSPARYAVRIKEPKGVSVSVKPNVLKFNKLGEEKKFKVILKAKWNGTADDYVFGGITWTDGIHYVRSPIAVYVVTA
ncbi:unnamed protein product [Linum tenue]|uniref:Uncharacterized protein n=1 Tax=Linum tenue TaxID=586396 RepID=A0AAV0M1F7_9ROSI|nr:unnamed protein product [Linum tenue]